MALSDRPLLACQCGGRGGHGATDADAHADALARAHSAADELAARPVFCAREWDVFVSRTLLLVWLMMVQSISGYILQRYGDLVSRHPILTYSLTFLIGCGGNASAQTATIVVRGLATGQFGPGNKLRVLAREVLIGLGMGSVLAVCGFVRVYCFFDGDVQASIAVSACLLLLCVAATVLATVLPFSLHQWGLDSAHSAPIAAVAMDIIGVSIACVVFSAAFTVLPVG